MEYIGEKQEENSSLEKVCKSAQNLTGDLGELNEWFEESFPEILGFISNGEGNNESKIDFFDAVKNLLLEKSFDDALAKYVELLKDGYFKNLDSINSLDNFVKDYLFLLFELSEETKVMETISYLESINYANLASIYSFIGSLFYNKNDEIAFYFYSKAVVPGEEIYKRGRILQKANRRYMQLAEKLGLVIENEQVNNLNHRQLLYLDRIEESISLFEKMEITSEDERYGFMKDFQIRFGYYCNRGRFDEAEKLREFIGFSIDSDQGKRFFRRWFTFLLIEGNVDKAHKLYEQMTACLPESDIEIFNITLNCTAGSILLSDPQLADLIKKKFRLDQQNVDLERQDDLYNFWRFYDKGHFVRAVKCGENLIKDGKADVPILDAIFDIAFRLQNLEAMRNIYGLISNNVGMQVANKYLAQIKSAQKEIKINGVATLNPKLRNAGGSGELLWSDLGTRQPVNKLADRVTNEALSSKKKTDD